MSDVITFNTETHAFGLQEPEFKPSGYGLGAMVAKMKSPVVLEIGCDVGDTSQFLLDSNPELILYGVDPYENYVDWNGRPLNEREGCHNNFMQRMKPYGSRFELIRKYSDNACIDFTDEFFDVIFIDGLHTYEQLSKDCQNFYSKLEPGGIFAGHDFTAIPGVNRAAKEFAEKVGKEILTTECDVWYWIK
jgi:predicted O-methyltransferase YrrM